MCAIGATSFEVRAPSTPRRGGVHLYTLIYAILISRHLKHPHMLSSGPNVESRRVAQSHHRRISPGDFDLLHIIPSGSISEEDPHAIHVGVEPLLKASTAAPSFISSICLHLPRQLLRTIDSSCNPEASFENLASGRHNACAIGLEIHGPFSSVGVLQIPPSPWNLQPSITNIINNT